MASRRIFIGVAVALVAGATLASWMLSRPDEEPLRLPGEFEQQGAVVVACRGFVDETPQEFVELIRCLVDRVPVILLCANEAERLGAQQALYAQGVPLTNVQFVNTPHSTMWVRDYGPFVAADADGNAVFIDSNYEWEEVPEIVATGNVKRVDDDKIPQVLASLLEAPIRSTRLTIDGGHILSNGQGLGVVTLGVLDHNLHHGLNKDQLRVELSELFGFREVILLESLPREPTGHADMLATFTAADTVVVAALDPSTDPHGAEALDRNAKKLAEVLVDGKRLNVVRLPIPYFSEDVWPTYTNVIYANGALLMPVYPGRDPVGRKTAKETYERLLPGWEIIELDAAWFLPKQGGPHCAVLNLGPVDITPLKTNSSAPVER